MEHIGDTAWFPGLSHVVVIHSEACSLALDPFKSVSVCLIILWGSHTVMMDPYSGRSD